MKGELLSLGYLPSRPARWGRGTTAEVDRDEEKSVVPVSARHVVHIGGTSHCVPSYYRTRSNDRTTHGERDGTGPDIRNHAVREQA